jgi:hypothetical protein
MLCAMIRRGATATVRDEDPLTLFLSCRLSVPPGYVPAAGVWNADPASPG